LVIAGDRNHVERWATVVRWLRRGFAVALVIVIVAALVTQWPEVRPQLGRASAPYLLGSFVAVVTALLFGMFGWRALVADLGSPLKLAPAARIFFVGQVGKYLPGSLWPVLAQMEMGRDEGVPRSRMAVSFLVTLVVSVLTGLVFGLPALLAGGGRNLALGIAAMAVGAPLLLSPPLLNGLISLGLRVLRRAPLEHPLSGGGIRRAVLFYLLSWLAYGVHLWLLAVDLGASPLRAFPVSVGAYCVAATLGMLFVIAPAGAGVREMLLIVGLASVLSSGGATAVAVLSRLVVMLGDVAAAATGAAHHRQHRTATATGAGEPS